MKVLIFLHGVFGSALESPQTSRTVYPGTLHDFLRGKILRRKKTKTTNKDSDTILNYDNNYYNSDEDYNEDEYNDEDDDDEKLRRKALQSVLKTQPCVMNDRDFELICKEGLRPKKIISSVYGLSVYSAFLRHIKKFTTYKQITEISEEQIKNCENILYCLPWNWIEGRSDAIKRLIMVMHDFQRIFDKMVNNTQTYFDGFLLIGHSEGGCAAILGAERWTNNYGHNHQYAPVLRVMCIGSPLNGSQKAINIIEGRSQGLHWFSPAQLLRLNNLNHCKMLYELLPYDYLMANLQNPKLSKRKIESALQFYTDLQPSGKVRYVFLYNKKKKTQLNVKDKTVNLERLPFDRKLIEILSKQHSKIDYNKKFQNLKDNNTEDGDGTVAWDVICSEKCTTLAFNSTYSHTFLLNDLYILQKIENFVK